MLLFINSPENFFTKFRAQKRQVWDLDHSVSPEAKTLRFASRQHTQEIEVPRKVGIDRIPATRLIQLKR